MRRTLNPYPSRGTVNVLYLTRGAVEKPGITLDEWLDYIEEDPGLHLEERFCQFNSRDRFEEEVFEQGRAVFRPGKGKEDVFHFSPATVNETWAIIVPADFLIFAIGCAFIALGVITARKKKFSQDS